MYNGIGLQTPRGSGTNGYIQNNKFFVKARSTSRVDTTTYTANDAALSEVKKANKEILEHDRKRQIEVKILVLQEALIDQGYTDSEISHKLDQARKDLEVQQQTTASASSARTPVPRFSDTQTHQVAARKEKQMETLRAALGIKHLEEPSSLEVDEQKQENEASSDNEENEAANDERQKKESRNHDTLAVEERGNLKKGNQTVEDSKTTEGLKKVIKERDRKKGDDDRGFRTNHDKEIGKERYSSGSDSDDNARHKERGKGHKEVTKVHDSMDDIDTSSKKSIKKVTSKRLKDGKSQRSMSSDSDSKENGRKRAQKYIEKRRRHDTDSDSNSDIDRKRYDSESDGDYKKKRKKTEIEYKKKYDMRRKRHDKYSRGHDSDLDENQFSGGSDSDDSESEGLRQKNRKRTAIEHKKHDRRHDGPNDSDNVSRQKYAVKNKKLDKYGRRHDSEGDGSEGYGEKRNTKGRHETDGISKRNTKGRHETDEISKRNTKGRHETDGISKRNTKGRHETDGISKRNTKGRHETDGISKRNTKGRHETDGISKRNTKGRHETDGISKRNEKHENYRKMDVGYVKANSDDIKRKRSRHDADDEKVKRQLSDGRKKHYHSNSSQSDYGSDLNSDDNQRYGRARHASKKTRIDLDDRTNDKLGKKQHGHASDEQGFNFRSDGRYDGKDRNSTDDGVANNKSRLSRRNDDDVDGSRKQERVRSREAEEERRKEGGRRGGHSKLGERSEDRIREGNLCSKNSEDEERYDDRERRYESKRRQHGNSERKYGEESGRHWRH